MNQRSTSLPGNPQRFSESSTVPEKSEIPRRRIALVIQYLGTHFHGWQRQVNQRTVQEELETVLATVLAHPVTVHAAGRTDAGVHAAAQVAHFEATSLIPPYKWASILNSRLADDVLIRGSAEVNYRWHARFSANWRRYRYTLYTEKRPNLFVKPFTWHYYYEPLDETLMRTALLQMQGRHQLSAFRRSGSSRPHSWVDVQEVLCQRHGSFISIEVQASGFLYGMMRLLVGMLVQVGRGQYSLETFAEIWQHQRREVVKYAAPAQGLCLLRVGYRDFPFPPSVWYDTLPHWELGLTN